MSRALSRRRDPFARTVSKSPSEAYVGGVEFLTPDAPDCATAPGNLQLWDFNHYGAENYAHLQQLKQRFDPDNRIRHPQSVHLPV